MSLSDVLCQKFKILSSKEESGILNAEINPAEMHSVLLALRDEMKFDALQFMTAIDWLNEGVLELVYHLYSYSTKESLVLRAKLSRGTPEIQSISDIYRTADWHERETHELFGINFIGHADLRNLLLPENFQGFPLRKDFTHPNLIPLPKT